MALSCCKKLFTLLRRIKSNNNWDFLMDPFRTENKLKKNIKMYAKIMIIAM